MPAQHRRELRTQLVELLEGSPTLRSPGGRQLFLQELDATLGGPPLRREHDTLHLQMIEVVNSCARQPGGLRAMAECLELLEPDQARIGELYRLVGEWPATAEDPRPERPSSDRPSSEAAGPDRRKVFVIHGRNTEARKALFAFLRAIGLHPIEWSQALSLTGKGSPYIGEVLDAAFTAAWAVIVLETPDDIAYLHPSLTHDGDPDTEPKPQPRANVLFEAGMAMGRHPERTVVVELGQVRVFSDIHGRHVVRLDNSIGSRHELAQRLRTAGCAVDVSGTDWHEAGNLQPPPPPALTGARKPPSTRATTPPELDARYIDNAVEVTNLGPGDVYDLDLHAGPDARLVLRSYDFPVPKLPAGKSVRVPRETGAPDDRSYFTVFATAKTVDGVALSAELFVSRS